MPEKKHIIIGTAGHIDHGKSSLVKALTGTDPDTLPEEKARGLTIELGFVFMDIPDYEHQVVFIDVPGHEKLVRTMVAGASHIHAALLVVAADEGIAVQTREHFDILQLLGIRDGLIALTKSDLVDSSRLQEVEKEVRNFARDTFLEAAPLIPVSAVTGTGLVELRAALMEIGRRVESPEDSGIFRMPIDRVFTVHGFGTVVAGTVLSGEVRVGDKVEILPDQIAVKVRGIQVHKERRERSGIGNRTALNLLDIEKDLLRRGQCAAAPGFLSPTQRLDARLRLLEDSPHELKTGERVRIHVGTDEIIARVVLLEADRVRPGEWGLVQFVLEAPTVALPSDRFIVRTFSPVTTIGGGEILDPSPLRHKRFDPRARAALEKLAGSLEDRVEQTIRKSSSRSLSAADISRSLGRNVERVGGALGNLATAGKILAIGKDKEERYVHEEREEALREKTMAAVRDHFQKNPHHGFMSLADLKSQMSKYTDEFTFKLVLDRLVDRGLLGRQEGAVRLPGHNARPEPKEQELAGRIEATYRRARFETPSEEEICRELGLSPQLFRKAAGLLIREKNLVRLDKKVTYHREALDDAREIVLNHLRKSGHITIAELKEILNTSRKYACALLEYFDTIRLTKRSGDAHELR